MLLRTFRKPTTPDLSPNLQWNDAVFGLRNLLPFSWPHWLHGQAEKDLAPAFCDLLGVSHAFTFDSGRAALHSIIRALQLKPEDEVILQSLTCVVVPNAILAAGATPVYVDIDATYNIDVAALERLISNSRRVKAVIVQHTFGQPASIKEIAALCKRNGIFLIEDCAHSLGAGVGSQLVGTFGDAAIFSFGRDKVLSTVSGGVATCTNPHFAERIQHYQSTLPYPSRRWIAQRLTYPVVFEVAKLLYHLGPVGKTIIALSKQLGIIPLVIQPAEKRGHYPTAYRLPNILALWAIRQLKTLERHNTHRRDIARIYRSGLHTLGRTGKVQVQETRAGTDPIWLRWSIQLDHADALRAFCRPYGIYLGNWYDTPIAPRDTDLSAVHYTVGCCPHAERLAQRIVNLPTSVNTSYADAMRIVNLITKFFEQDV